MILRTGRKVGRTIYSQQGDEPSDTDPLVGVMDTVELASAVVQAYNRHAATVREDPTFVLPWNEEPMEDQP